jgi:Replicase family/Primase C terminal 1 (PriCT-1)
MVSAAIERFIGNLPLKPYCSEDPRRFGVYPRQRDLAIGQAYIQPNAPWKTVYIALDVDDEGAAFVVDDAGLPSPTFTVVNPQTAHAHLLYELSDPVYPGRSNKADWLLSAVRGGLTRMLSADLGYRGPLVQNPLNYRWRRIVTENRYGLGDLAAEIPAKLLQPQRAASAPQLGPIWSRNCHLFEAIRRIAYSEVKLARDLKAFHQRMLELCRTGNVYRPALPDAAIRAIARSIAKWTWERRETIGSHWRRGVLSLGPIVEQGDKREHTIRVRQQAGADYARDQRTLAVNARIKTAVEQLSREGKRVTVTAIARWAHVSRMTVYRYQRETLGVSVGGHPEGAIL